MRLPSFAAGWHGNVAALLFAAVCLLAASRPAGAHRRQDAAGPAVALRATWDDAYVYFAFRVDDSDITGTNARPMSQPEADDSVAVYFHTGVTRPDAPDAATHAMIVSVAGGFTFLEGNPVATAFVPHPLFTIKYGVNLRGTLNRSDDRDRDYTVTLAVPLTALGLDPKSLKPGTEIDFNAVVRSRAAGALTAFAPGVKTEVDAARPSAWARLRFAPPGSAANAPNVLVAPQVDPKAKSPIINGAIEPSQWPGAPIAAFASPDKPKAVVAAAPVVPINITQEDTRVPVLRFDQPIAGMQRLIMARYVPTFQADGHKVTLPRRGIFAPDDTLLLVDQPITGIGPWFSSDRTTWHRNELADMRRSGVDVALIQIGGPEGGDTALMDEKALTVLVCALRDMAANHVPVPLVAPYFDTAALAPVGTAKPDLSQARGRDLVYAAVRRWMNLVPPEFRARVIVPPSASETALVAAYPIFLSDGAALSGIDDPSWTDTLRARFAQDFGTATIGTTLMFIGGTGFEAAGAKIAAVLPSTSGKGSGSVSTFVVQPGIEVRNGPFTPRANGAAYRTAWEAALAARPAWTIIDSWNDFSRGTEVTGSRQYGFQYVDQTRIFAVEHGGLENDAVRWLAQDAPRRMRPGGIVATTVTLQNAGANILRGDEGVALTYRWLQNNKVIAESPLRLPLTGLVLPTRTATLTLGLAALLMTGDGRLEPLPPGEYVAEIDLARASSPTDPNGKAALFGSAPVSPPLRVPVTITPDLPDYVEFGGTTTPTLLLGGASYPVDVRLRWMGANPLALDAATLVYQVVSEDGRTVLTTGSAPLPATLQSGQWVSVPATITMAEATIPTAAAYPEQRGSAGAGGYRLRWILTRSQTVAPVPGEYSEHVAVYPPEDEAGILPPEPLGKSITAGDQTAINVTVLNRGARAWKKGDYFVGFHWYDPDGIDEQWKPVYASPIEKDVKPGESTRVRVLVRAPDHEGDFILAFDVMRAPDVYLSTRPVTRSGDLGLVPVRVVGGQRLRYVDLTRFLNVNALASEAAPDGGNFDGAGNAFPAESFPPDLFGVVAYLDPAQSGGKAGKKPSAAVYPSGFYSQSASTARTISFRYATDADGAMNAVACDGQTLDIGGHDRFFGLHLAAAATGGGDDRPLNIVLHYRDGTTQTVIGTVPEWTHAPSATEALAVVTHQKRTKTGDVAQTCAVRHIILPIDISKELQSITLPSDKQIKVFAITLEHS